MNFRRALAFAPLASLVTLFAAACNDDGTALPVSADAGPGKSADASADAPSPAPQDGGGGALHEGGLGGDSGSSKPQSDALVTSFAFVGCNRLQKADWSASQNPSSANLPQLKQTFADLAALADKPKFFFFTGDLVLSMKPGTTDLSGQLDGWAAVYKADPIASKTELVPLVGNHEMLYKDKVLGAELSNGPADSVWSQWLSAQGFASRTGNGPSNAGPNADALEDDQTKLSFSFDDGGTHFVVLNTDTWTTTPDPSTGDTQIGWIALHWLTADLAAAQANASISRIFVLGHKPIVAPSGLTTSDEAINPSLASGLASLLDGTPKVKGYFCAHAHEWDARKLPGTRGVYQIIAGNGGSQLENDWNVAVPYYGFTQARVYASGKVGIVSYQRPVPSPYTSSPAAAAKAAPELTIAP